MSATEIFDNELASGRITSERALTYGSPVQAFATICDLKEILARCDDPELRHVLEMIAVKMSRIIASPTHIDSWVDIAGYARTAMMVIDARSVLADEHAAMCRSEASYQEKAEAATSAERGRISATKEDAIRCHACGAWEGDKCRSTSPACARP